MSNFVQNPAQETYHLTEAPRQAQTRQVINGVSQLVNAINPLTNLPEMQIATTVVAIDPVERTGTKKNGEASYFYIVDVLVAEADFAKRTILTGKDGQPIVKKMTAIVPASQIEKVTVGNSYWATLREIEETKTFGISIGGLRCASGAKSAEDFGAGLLDALAAMKAAVDAPAEIEVVK